MHQWPLMPSRALALAPNEIPARSHQRVYAICMQLRYGCPPHCCQVSVRHARRSIHEVQESFDCCQLHSAATRAMEERNRLARHPHIGVSRPTLRSPLDEPSKCISNDICHRSDEMQEENPQIESSQKLQNDAASSPKACNPCPSSNARTCRTRQHRQSTLGIWTGIRTTPVQVMRHPRRRRIRGKRLAMVKAHSFSNHSNRHARSLSRKRRPMEDCTLGLP